MHCLSASATRDNLNLIAVVLGAPDSQKRFNDAANLLDYGFDNFVFKEGIAKNDVIIEVPVKKGKEDVVMALEAIVEPLSLYDPVYSDGGDPIYVMDQIGDKNDDTEWLDELLLRQAIDELSEREKRILSMRFLNGLTQVEVAKEIGISQAQVSRVEKGALKRIKGKM